MQRADAYRMLKAAWRNGRLSHAYLLVGSTKKVVENLTIEFLQLIFCELNLNDRNMDDTPCGKCNRCLQVSTRKWCDITWIAPEKKSRIISVDQIRNDVLHAVLHTSFAGDWKAVVIADAERMNEQASNAFLKTLEEPSDKTVFLLQTDSPHYLLPTIISRCQRIDVEDFDSKDGGFDPWRKKLLDAFSKNCEATTLASMARSSAICAVFAEMNQEAKKEVLDKIREEEERGRDEDKDVIEARIRARYHELRSAAILILTHWYRDLLMLTINKDDETLYFDEYASVLKSQAECLTVTQALSCIDYITELNRQLESHIPEVILFSYWMDRLAIPVRKTG